MLSFDRIASTLLFGLAANTDNVTIGIAYGMKRRLIGWKQNLLIAVVTTAITLVALAAGREIRELLPSRLPDMLGGTLLVAFAAWNFYREGAGVAGAAALPVRSAERRTMGLGETLFLSGTLSINNIGLAVAGGVGGVGYAPAAISIFCFSVTMLALGQAIGTNFIRLTSLQRVLRAPASGNAVLVIAGVLMLAGY